MSKDKRCEYKSRIEFRYDALTLKSQSPILNPKAKAESPETRTSEGAKSSHSHPHSSQYDSQEPLINCRGQNAIDDQFSVAKCDRLDPGLNDDEVMKAAERDADHIFSLNSDRRVKSVFKLDSFRVGDDYDATVPESSKPRASETPVSGFSPGKECQYDATLPSLEFSSLPASFWTQLESTVFSSGNFGLSLLDEWSPQSLIDTTTSSQSWKMSLVDGFTKHSTKDVFDTGTSNTLPSMSKSHSDPSYNKWIEPSSDRSPRTSLREESSPAVISDHCIDLNDGIDDSYLSHWHNNVLEALPPVLREVSSMINAFPALKHAILAVSACNLGRSRPEIKLCTEKGTFYGPSRRHQHRSQNYYNAAIRMLTHFSEAQYKADSMPILAVLLLFSYIEIGTGSFSGFSLHLHGVEMLISDQFNTFKTRHVGRKLLGVWIRLRAYNWWLRRPFSAFNFQKSLDLMGISSSLEDIFWTYDMRREVVLMILCESHRLNCMVLMERSLQGNTATGTESISSMCYRNIEEHLGHSGRSKLWRPKILVPDEDYLLLLGKQLKRLNDWHSMLQMCDLPIESFAPTRFDVADAFTATTFVVHPLKFQTHSAAMDYAYYINARIMQSTDILDSLTQDEDSGVLKDEDKINPWIVILLRIAAGLDFMTCVRQNVYTVGIVSQLLACVLRCPSLLVGQWVEQWIKRFTQLLIFEEGSAPILQVLDILRTVNHERENGRHIFAAYTEAADGVRLDSYNGQDITSLIVYGKMKRTGRLFCDHIAIKAEVPT